MKKTHKIIYALQNTIDEGKQHLAVWKQTQAAMKQYPEIFELAAGYFLLSAVAHVDTVVLCASKLLEEQSCSVTFTYLFNIFHKNKKVFTTDWNEIARTIEADRQHIENLQKKFEKVRVERVCTEKCVNGSNWAPVFKANGKLVED